MLSPAALSGCLLRPWPSSVTPIGTSVTGKSPLAWAVCTDPKVRAPIHCPCLFTLQKAREGPSTGASDQESVAVLVLASCISWPCQPHISRAVSRHGFCCHREDVHPWVLAELFMQKQGTTEVGHLGCVIQDALEQSKGRGEEGEEKTES